MIKTVLQDLESIIDDEIDLGSEWYFSLSRDIYGENEPGYIDNLITLNSHPRDLETNCYVEEILNVTTFPLEKSSTTFSCDNMILIPSNFEPPRLILRMKSMARIMGEIEFPEILCKIKLKKCLIQIEVEYE